MVPQTKYIFLLSFFIGQAKKKKNPIYWTFSYLYSCLSCLPILVFNSDDHIKLLQLISPNSLYSTGVTKKLKLSILLICNFVHRLSWTYLL